MAECLEIAESSIVKLNKLSCPFTWEFLKEAAEIYNFVVKKPDDDESPDPVGESDGDEFPDPVEDRDMEFFVLISKLVRCFNSALSGDTDSAESDLQDAEECLQRIRQSNGSCNIIRTIEHIVYATKCHFLYQIHNNRELENILQDIVDISNFTVEEHGALQGFKGVAYNIYGDWGLEKAIDAAMEATQKNEQNAIWHFLLGINLRRKRRLISLHISPSSLEKESLERAFVLSKNLTFGMYYAQMKFESEYAKARRDRTYEHIKLEKQLTNIYDSVLDSNTKSLPKLLRATLGYLRICNSYSLVQAERCLDALDKFSPNNVIALHYRGLLYRNRKNYKEALKFFKLAADLGNFSAEINYVELGWQIGSVDPVEHLLNMETKYTDLIRYRQQKLYLLIATSYVRCNKASNAAEYYLKAIDVDPDSLQLTCFFKFLNLVLRNGIYHFLQHDFLPSCPRARLDPMLLHVVDQLHERCIKHSDTAIKDIEKQLCIVKI